MICLTVNFQSAIFMYLFNSYKNFFKYRLLFVKECSELIRSFFFSDAQLIVLNWEGSFAICGDTCIYIRKDVRIAPF
jgi:hypothetical protein